MVGAARPAATPFIAEFGGPGPPSAGAHGRSAAAEDAPEVDRLPWPLRVVPVLGERVELRENLLQLGDAARVAPIDKLSVVLVAVLAFLILGERPAARDWIAILLIGSGVVLLALRR